MKFCSAAEIPGIKVRCNKTCTFGRDLEKCHIIRILHIFSMSVKMWRSSLIIHNDHELCRNLNICQNNHNIRF